MQHLFCTKGHEMRPTQRLNISLPNVMADAINAKVANGEYATMSEVVYEGLCLLFERDRAVEQWLRSDVATAYDELRVNPSKALTPAQIREHLGRRRRATSRKM